MSSPSTPVAPLRRNPFNTQSWRPWSQPVDPVRVLQTVCGLLNRVTRGTAELMATRFAELVVRAETGGDPTVVEACAEMVVKRCVVDPRRVDLFAKMVQKAVDEVEGEELRWRTVDPYHLVNPATSLQSTLRTAVLDELHLALEAGRVEHAHALATFVGELLVLGVLSCGDVHDLVDLLFKETAKNGDCHCVCLCRIIRRAVSSTEASQIIDGLTLVDEVECVLQEDTISLKVRYMMMDILDQCLYPRPQDVFTSDIRRSEVYGLHDDLDDEDTTVPPAGILAPPSPPAHVYTLSARCREEADLLMASRDLRKAETFCRALPPRSRHRFLRALVSAALSSGNEADANLIATFLSHPQSKTLLRTDETLTKAFEPDIAALEDTALDVPRAYHLVAIMLSAAGLPQASLEDLAARIVVGQNAARDHLLEEVASLGASPDDGVFHGAAVVEETSEDEAPASDYAYAY
ncbi:hypothetical protein BD413DRAFT_265157 [Trametes elegans]|nr:hypothetical protein BD413DRAFT_265157 [Trametes elegans]